MRVPELKLASLSSVIFVQRQFCCNKAPKGLLLPRSPLWEYRHEITEFATKKKAVQFSKTKTILWTNCSVKKKLKRHTNLIAFFVFARIVKTCRNHWFVFPNHLHGIDLSWNHWERIKFGDVTKTIKRRILLAIFLKSCQWSHLTNKGHQIDWSLFFAR